VEQTNKWLNFIGKAHIKANILSLLTRVLVQGQVGAGSALPDNFALGLLGSVWVQGGHGDKSISRQMHGGARKNGSPSPWLLCGPAYSRGGPDTVNDNCQH